MHRCDPVALAARPALRLASPEGLEATFVPGAGLVGASLRDRGAELLGRAGEEALAAYVAQGRLCGLPLLHPWANRLRRDGYAVEGTEVHLPADAPLVRRDGAGRPIHGLATACPDWKVEACAAHTGAAWLEASLDWTQDARRRAGFPFPHRLEVRATVSGRTLALATTLRATGERPVPVAFGWHPYLRLPDVPRSAWQVTLPVRERYVLDAGCLPTGRVEPFTRTTGPLGTRCFDDLFRALVPGAPFVLEGGGRRIEVHFDEGFERAVVYAPGDADVMCFEPMTAPTDPFEGGEPLQWVEPGGAFTGSFRIRVASAG